MSTLAKLKDWKDFERLCADLLFNRSTCPQNLVNAASGGQGLFLEKPPLNSAKTFD